MYVVDEVTGRIYVLKGDIMERVPEVAGRRRKEDMEMPSMHRFREKMLEPKTPEVQGTPVPVAESTRQTHRTPSSRALRTDQEGLSFAGLVEVTQIRRPSPPRDETGPETELDKPQANEKGWGGGCPEMCSLLEA